MRTTPRLKPLLKVVQRVKSGQIKGDRIIGVAQDGEKWWIELAEQ